MKMIDVKCPQCDTVKTDVLLRPSDAPFPLCLQCGERTERTHTPGTSHGIVPDGIPGGILIQNGLCHADGTPRRFDSRTDIARHAKETKWGNVVEHKGSAGSDKSKHTQRFI